MNKNAEFGSYLFSSIVPCMIVARNGFVEHWNPASSALFPTLDQAPRIALADLFLQQAHEEDAVRLEYLLKGKEDSFFFDFSQHLIDGSDRWFKLIMTRQSNGKYLAIIDDISTQKIKESHLMAAKENAEQASVTRSQFLANISHEIRTPIQTIIGMMELLTDTRLDEEQTEYARQVRFSADVLLTLINDILDISKVEAGQLKMEDIDFNVVDVIERTVDLISMEGHKKGLEINIDISPSIPVMLRGDPGRLRQVILNLVKNAVKFTESGGLLLKVRIHTHENGVSLDGTALQYLRFEIQDTGIGIPKEAQQKLFTQFFQADASTTRRFGGTGLGLAISKNIVSLMGGEIGVKDNEPTGCTFWFTMPLRPSAIQPPGELLPLNSETRFLLVDDNPQTIKILTGMLISLGYTHVLAALSGKEALETLQTARAQGKSFDIVFIDMVMPEMDGWRLAAEINKDRAINDAQLYLMVPEGSFGADAKMKLLEWFNGYLYKPIKQHLLMDLLKEHYQSSIDLEVIDELEPVDEEEPTIPVRPTSAAKEELPIDKPTTPPLAKGLTILVAEDHPVNRKLLTILLEKAGATVVGAADGKEAIEQAEKHTFDLVFMDIQMPRMNGYEASRWMREHNIYTPIIACTASAQENERENCLECGMTDVLPKPYKKQDVFTLIGTYAKAQTEDDPFIFDPQLMFEIMMGDLESAKTLLQEFLEQTTAHIAIVREDIEKADIQSARKSAHLIKGSALNVTAKRLAEAARLIEEAPEGESTATLLSHVESLSTEYRRLTTHLDTTGYLAGNKGHP